MANKKNHNFNVTFSKYLNFVKENKLYIVFLILLLLTIRFQCGWVEQDFKLSVECNPLSINEIKEVIK